MLLKIFLSTCFVSFYISINLYPKLLTHLYFKRFWTKCIKESMLSFIPFAII